MATTRASTTNFDQSWPRWISLVLGVWLFISAFLWPHSPASYTNTWVVGALIALAALGALFSPPVRWANTVLAIWLFISTLVIDHVTVATAWNNAIVAVVVFFVSLAPSRGATTTTTMAGRTATPMTT